MNQILVDEDKNKKKKKVFVYKIQFILSISLSIIIIFIIFNNYNEAESLEKISKVLDKRMELYSLYNITQLEKSSNNIYLGRIIIDKINIEYSVFNRFDEELLKIAPCKFYGKNLAEKGNICIAAHNYNDNRFFGKLDELELKDIIKIKDLNNIEYDYIVYDIFEIDEDDFSILKGNKNYELTLLTCNNSNNKRIIVKAYRKEY